MPDLTESNEFSSVRQIEITDSILGGTPYSGDNINSPINVSLQQLANRTHYLRQLYASTATVPNADETQHGLVRIATAAEITTGTATNRAATPFEVRRKIRTTSPTPSYATTSAAGVVELADSDEINDGSSTTRVATVARFNEMIGIFGGGSDHELNDWSYSSTSQTSTPDANGEYRLRSDLGDPKWIARYAEYDNNVIVYGYGRYEGYLGSSQTTANVRFYNATPSIPSSGSVVGSMVINQYDSDSFINVSTNAFRTTQGGNSAIGFNIQTPSGSDTSANFIIRFFIVYETS